MARLRDVGNVWKTIKEIDVQAIRQEAEQTLRIAVVGAEDGRGKVIRLLRGGGDRYPATGGDPLEELAIPLPRQRQPELSRANMLLLVLDGRRTLSGDEYLAYEKLLVVGVPLLLVVLGATVLPAPAAGQPDPDWRGQRAVFLADPADRQASSQLGEALLDLLPSELHMAAARRLPGLRSEAAQSLIRETAVSNATYALTSGLPELIPLLNIPLTATDMLVLTKNQALLVYRIALAMGAPPNFTAQMQEILPVVGGAFLWRQLARQLVGLVPGFGLLPKVAVAYAGTFSVGQVAWRWYARHEATSGRALRALMRQALTDGRRRAQDLLPGLGDQQGGAGQGGLRARIVRLLRRRRQAPPADQAVGGEPAGRGLKDRIIRMLPGGKKE